MYVRLRAAAGTAADHGIELRLHNDVGEALRAIYLDTGPLQDGLQLLAGELRTAAQGADDCSLAAAEDCRVKLEPAVIGRHAGTDARPCERQHPADVFGRDEMPCWPHDVRAENASLAEGPLDLSVRCALHSQPQSPFRVAILLRLYRAQPADDVLRFRKAPAGQPLISQAQEWKVERHVNAMLPTGRRIDARRRFARQQAPPVCRRNGIGLSGRTHRGKKFHQQRCRVRPTDAKADCHVTRRASVGQQPQRLSFPGRDPKRPA